MSNLFSKHFHLCFFNLKYPTTTAPLSPPPSPSPPPPPPPPPPPSVNSNAALLFTSRNHPLSDAATSSAFSTSKSTNDFSSSSDSDSWDPPPDFASVFASQRFFFSSPGLSNSIVESPDTRPSNTNTTSSLIPRGGVRVPKYSLNPYTDFRRSMQEMIESRELLDVRKDWDYLHELLLCYLALNPSHTHKYIVRAFTDLVVDLLSSPPSSSAAETSHFRKKPENRRQSSFSGRLV